jgi:hypothetical protein
MEITPIWVKNPSLPIELWSHEALNPIGNVLETLYAIDMSFE